MIESNAILVNFVSSTSGQIFNAIGIISNLLLNAINCSINGNVTLMVSQRNISVIDNGVGLNKKPWL
ncbi:hypothetical protein ACMAZF_03350 [Psychrobium sp. nBUS_13]|uniref:hypothetical protein n=1 Tax=Psychrobium sp. nBUS_13 TaxID=3395319 RepID=UPI003EC0D05A